MQATSQISTWGLLHGRVWITSEHPHSVLRMLSMVRTFFAFLGIFALCFVMTGCRSSGKPKVAFVSNNAHGFWTFVQRGAEDAAAKYDVELEFRKPSEDSAKVQREIIEDLMNRGFKGVAVSPNDPDNNLSFFKNTVAKKMALV